ncbi:tetratricopeptide repeat protein [Streptomyces sp. NPDC002769]|uniref:tetratricopeptide repeat protein n=1 Tax=Streptomyces sp. NPDC002769 TaxID=3154542 RepID=UPI00332DE876
MSRLTREQKRELKRQRSAAVPGGHAGEPAPALEVHVPTSALGATVGGVPLAVTPGETVQGAVLNHLHRIARATGHPVLARVHDERIGFVVPLQVYGDGSSRYAGEPVRVGTPPPAPPLPPRPSVLPPSPPPEAVAGKDAGTQALRPVPDRSPEPALDPASGPAPERAADPLPEPLPEPGPHPVSGPAPDPVARPVPEADPEPGSAAVPERVPAPDPELVPDRHSDQLSDRAKELVPDQPSNRASELVPDRLSDRPLDRPSESAPEPVSQAPVWPEPVSDAVPGPEPVSGPLPEPTVWPEAPSTHVLRVVQGPVAGARPGVAVAPTGEFGPAPEMPPAPEPLPPAPTRATPAAGVVFARHPSLAAEAMAVMEPEPDPKPTPARGFDAVAESVLTPVVETEGAAFLAEPVTRINEAVKEGRIDEAATMAERTVADAARTLGPDHPEVLRLGELSAYIAYLAGDALRSFHLSLDLARVRRQQRDPDAAYGNVQSAATAWRAVRDPAQGMNLGRVLIEVWTGLVADGGPAADDLEQLESARTRMGRLAERARARAGESAN